MQQVSSRLGVPVARVYGVATFYNQFRFVHAPANTSSSSAAAPRATSRSRSCCSSALKRRLDLRDSGNSRDDRFTVQTVACLGACSLAPVLRIDGEFYGHLTPEKLDRLLNEVDAADKPETAAQA